MNEKLILKEIDNLNNTYDKSIEDLDVKINKANIRRVTICNKYQSEVLREIQYEMDFYSQKVENSNKLLHSDFSKELAALCITYEKELKSFHLDFSKMDKDDIGKRELLKKV